MKLSFREKVLLIAFILVGVGYLFYSFLYSPIQTQRDMLAEENKNLKSQVKVTANKARQNSGIVRNAQEQKLKDSFQEQVIKVPGDMMLPEALVYLQKSAKASGVNLNSLVFTPGAAATANGTGTNSLVSANEVKINLVAKGGYSGLKAFLLKIQKAPRLYRIDTVKMQSNYEQAAAQTPPAPSPGDEDAEAVSAVTVPTVKNEITMNLNMVTFYQEYKAPGFIDDQQRVKPGKGQDNPFTI
ncbi:MAG: type 4a pilus biogenesis protein PilO [Deltaproteobacteria bacterium]